MPQHTRLNLKSYDTFRKYIRHEDNLVNQRISWMLVIHGFLYAAYALTVQQNINIGTQLTKALQDDKTLALAPTSQVHYLRDAVLQTEFVLLLITFIGFVISLVAFRSIRAARKAAINVQTLFEGQFGIQEEYSIPETVTTEEHFILPTIAGGGDRKNRIGGIFSAQWIPVVLMISWVISLVVETWLLFGFYPVIL
jgi:hypothetical protein